jgi:short-chain fatty acids transporter
LELINENNEVMKDTTSGAGELARSDEAGSPAEPSSAPRRLSLSRVAELFVFLFERVMPDPFVFAIILTIVTALLAYTLVKTTTLGGIAQAWYSGVFSIFTFGFQMVLIVVTGYALASSPLVHAGLERVASWPKTPRSAVSLTIVISMIASWLNWGFGLVAAGLLAREIAKRIHVDFGWLVAAAYTGFVISPEGISGSIVLSQATPGSALNLVEKTAGMVLPLTQTIFSRFTLIPVLFLLVVLPLIYRTLQPAPEQSHFADAKKLHGEDQSRRSDRHDDTFGDLLDNAWILNLSLAALAMGALVWQWSTKGAAFDLNSVIIICLLLGLIFHWRPVAYVDAVRHAARVTGPMILQYPLYGGIMGIMTTTGLAGIISKAFLVFSTSHTLPFWTYISSLVITLFIPSGGGHWAVQGPFVLPAAKELHTSLAGTTMAVAMGESVANMIQPFFALPLLAIAGIPMRRMMGFMVITFLVSLVAFGVSLLMLLPRT